MRAPSRRARQFAARAARSAPRRQSLTAATWQSREQLPRNFGDAPAEGTCQGAFVLADWPVFASTGDMACAVRGAAARGGIQRSLGEWNADQQHAVMEQGQQH